MPSLDPLVKRAFENAGIETAALTHKGQALTDGSTTYFVKASRNVSHITGEAESLRHMALTAPPGLIPRLFGVEVQENKAGMVSEYFDLGGRKDQQRLGRLLAEMHRPPPADIDTPGVKPGHYGFDVPTFCGATQQDNTWTEDWKTFFVERRLGDIVRRIGDGDLIAVWEDMQDSVIPLLLDDFSPAPEPVIVHGDLWSGNVGNNSETGLPVIYDPCSAYAHNEYELGICHMFGGFTPEFFAAYHAVHPRSEPHHDQRIRLYELYHHLNVRRHIHSPKDQADSQHALMFGFGYKSGAKSIMRELIEYSKRAAKAPV